MDSSQERAVVLLSGGLDSATCLALALNEGHHVTGLVVDYGQRHRRELEASRALAQHYQVPLKEMVVDLRTMGGSALTDDGLAVPHDTDLSQDPDSEIPVTYVPARNTLFLALALGLAEVEGARAIYIGANALDYSGYPDCRPVFLEAFQKMADLATKAGVKGQGPRLQAPLLELTKAQIITRGTQLDVPYELTWSCYEGGPSPCGSCDSCRLRAKGFQEAGKVDPLV